MSTTVSYNGSQIASLENETKSLLTANSWLTSNITVTDTSSGGGSCASSNADVTFIDYDGTVLHSFSASEFAALTAMPANPSHTGLTAQGWNWSLADAKEQLTAYPEAGLTIGQMYITDDGKTRLYVHMEEGRLHPYLGICPNGTVVVDWGDGSSTDTLTGTSLTSVTVQDHEYASEGDYTITLEVTSGSFQFYGTTTTSYIFRKVDNTAANIHRVYSACIRRVELGANASIGGNALRYCSNLSSVTIPDGVTSIGGSAFYYCYNLSSVTIPDGVTNIGSSAFYNCYNLSSVAIPNGVTNIGGNAFYYCYSLSSVTIPNGVTYIGGSTFNYCSNLSGVTFPDSVTSIMNSMFSNCAILSGVTIPDSVKSIGSSAFSNCYSLSGVTIPDSVTTIENYAFYNCYSLLSVAIPNGVTNIGSNVFYNCYSLSSVTIPDGVTSIGASAFFNCYSLSSITIPDGVTSIDTQAFYSCYGIAEYHFLPTTPPTLANTNAFTNIQSDCVMYVPQGSLEAYQTAENWSTYADYMVEEE